MDHEIEPSLPDGTILESKDEYANRLVYLERCVFRANLLVSLSLIQISTPEVEVDWHPSTPPRVGF